MGVGVYLILLFCFVLLLVLSRLKNNSLTRMAPYLILALFSGFRYQVGVDFESYESIFQSIVNERVDTSFIEPGYFYLVRIVNHLSGTQQLVFLAIALLTLFFIYKYIEGNSNDFFLSSFIYLTLGPMYISSFNGIRQALAIAIFAYSIKHIKERNLLKYIGLILVASMFHKSALFLLPLFFFLDRKISYLKSAALFAGIIVVTQTGLIQRALSVSMYSSYLDYRQLQMDNSVTLFLLLSLVLVFLGKPASNSTNWRIFYNLNLLSFFTILSAFLTSDLSNMIFMRLNNYFFIGYAVFIPLNVNRIKQKYMAYTLTMMFFLAYFINTVLTGRTILPYNTNFNLFNLMN